MRILIGHLICLLVACSSASAQNNKLKISHLTGDVYIYTSYGNYQGNKIPANGMYIVGDAGVLLLDTPWDTTQFQPLLDSIRLRHKKQVTICIATHWHSDRTEGLEYYRNQGIRTYTTVLTDELSKQNGKKRAEYLMTKDTLFQIGNHKLETYYPGGGHTADNIVLWLPQEKILYGGCLIKGVDDKTLGNLGDADTYGY